MTLKFNEARGYVLNNIVDVLFTTASNSTLEFVGLNFRPDWMIVEEASRIPEGEYATLAFRYKNMIFDFEDVQEVLREGQAGIQPQ
jgi:hypothetical protein